MDRLEPDSIVCGDARAWLPRIAPNSVALGVWSPPYFVGKTYESHLSFDGWCDLLRTVIGLHFPILKPGSFLVINIADILTFKDPAMPRIQANVVGNKRIAVTKSDILCVIERHPGITQHQIAELLGCSEQTIARRLNGNNARGGKRLPQTRVKLVGGLIEAWAMEAGFFLYDRRIWVKDAAWSAARWTNLSYRAVDEFEYLFFFWKPGETVVDRRRLSDDEWRDWGSRGVWHIPSVRSNHDHESKFPVELPLRVIKLLTDPGDIVVDCFIGSGTTAIAAIRTGRRYIGIDIVPRSADLARSNIAQELQRMHAAQDSRMR